MTTTTTERKAKRIERSEKRAKRQGCGHGSRWRGKFGCAKCRRANGATIRRPLRKGEAP